MLDVLYYADVWTFYRDFRFIGEASVCRGVWTIYAQTDADALDILVQLRGTE